MRVNIEDLRLGMAAITQTIYVYIPDKKNPENMLHKKDVTSDFRSIAIKQIDEKDARISELKDLLENSLTLNSISKTQSECSNLLDSIELKLQLKKANEVITILNNYKKDKHITWKELTDKSEAYRIKYMEGK